MLLNVHDPCSFWGEQEPAPGRGDTARSGPAVRRGGVLVASAEKRLQAFSNSRHPQPCGKRRSCHGVTPVSSSAS
jgi:hypothetical protein